MALECDICHKKFKHQNGVIRHKRLKHGIQPRHFIISCEYCGSVFDNKNSFDAHMESTHQPATDMEKYHSSGDYLRFFRKFFTPDVISISQAMSLIEKQMFAILKYYISKWGSVKSCIIFYVQLAKLDILEQEQRYIHVCRGPMKVYDAGTNIRQNFQESLVTIESYLQSYLKEGSDWNLDKVSSGHLELYHHNPLRGSCSNKNVCISNLEFIDSQLAPFSIDDSNDCFLRAVARFFVNSSSKKAIRSFIAKNMKVKIDLPVVVSDIPKFERHNSHLDLSINVIYCYRDETTRPGSITKWTQVPVYRSSEPNKSNHINLALVRVDKNNLESPDMLYNHYFLISDVSKFLRPRYINTANNRRSQAKTRHCPNCLRVFWYTDLKSAKKKLENHQRLCFKNQCQLVELPKFRRISEV